MGISLGLFLSKGAIVSDNITDMSEKELAELISKATKVLDTKRGSKKRDGIAKIKEIAASIGVQVDIIDTEKRSSRAGSKVAVKYRDPTNPKNAWTGRGMKPRWLRAFLEQGRSLDEFLV